jgi:hypothetical protein
VKGEINHADALTKPRDKKKMKALLFLVGIWDVE